jgi:ornithine cyclodeaminase/alanine dehydrogenase
MSNSLLYLSRRDVLSTGITPAEARNAVLSAFRDHAAGLNRSLPKASLDIGPGHGFQSMPAASAASGIATLKWVAMAPVPAGSTVQGINGLLCVSDYTSGAPVAVMDADEITLIRTAAMSAAAAIYLAPKDPSVIGFVGCGQQAYAHLDAFLDLFPNLSTVLTFSRSMASAEALAKEARRRGLAAEATSHADGLLSQSDIVISTVPGAPGLQPFLDAAKMPSASFASAVDIGRSWIPSQLPAFDLLATDSLDQSRAPYDVSGRPVDTVQFTTDLVSLAASDPAEPQSKRAMFCFRGFALADLALAEVIVTRARERGIGVMLER